MFDNESSENRVSIVIPVYNEAGHLASSLTKTIARLDELQIPFEIVIVESGSTDMSKKIVSDLSQTEERVRLICQEKREGMGSAIAEGFKSATGYALFWMDSDNPYDLVYLKEALEKLKTCDVVAGYRKSREEPFKRILYSKVFNIFVKIVFSIRLKDINFSFKLFRKEVIDNITIESKSSFFAAEMLIKAKKRGYSFKQLPVEYIPRKDGESKLGNLNTVFGILAEMFRFIFTGRPN